MRTYECDLCGEQVQIMEDLYRIDFSHYGSSGTCHNYFDACLSCYRVVNGQVLKMVEDKEKRKIEGAG